MAVQLAAVLGLFYISSLGTALAMILCFVFGSANAAHMLAFSTAADVVEPRQIGTSAAIVNGLMFILGGILISRPGVRIGMGIESGLEPASVPLAQYAGLSLMIACSLALVIALIMKETYPHAAK